MDTVFHLAAVLIANDPAAFERVNVGGTRNMVQAARAAGVKQFILVSSASVVYPKTTAYSRSKRECERIVREQSGMHWTIVRPTLAYNEHGGEEFRMFLDYLRKYPVVPFIGRGRALKNPVHVDDLMRGFLAVVGNPEPTARRTTSAAARRSASGSWLRLMLKHQGIEKPFLTLPVGLCTALARVAGAPHGAAATHLECDCGDHTRREPRQLRCSPRPGLRAHRDPRRPSTLFPAPERRGDSLRGAGLRLKPHPTG